MINLQTQFWVGIILASFIFVLYKRRFFKKSSISLWTFLVIIFLLLSNAIFGFCAERKIGFISVLNYKDAQIMMISLIPTVAIAFFQYMIQEELKAEEKIRTQENRIRNEMENKRHQLWHRQELCSERIQKFYSFFDLKGEAINLNLVQSLGKYGNLESAKTAGYVFYLELHPTKDKKEIFPGCYKVCFSNISIDEKKVEMVDGIHTELTNNHLKVLLKKEFAYETIVTFFVQNDGVLKCSFDIDLEDTSLERGYLHMLLSVSFDIVAQCSYDSYGSFKICTRNVEIQLNELMNLEEQN